MTPNPCIDCNRYMKFEVNWISGYAPTEPLRCKVKIRYRMKEQTAIIYPGEKNTAHIEFDEPQRAKTAGQAAVFYDEDIVLGGGIIHDITR